MTSVSNTSLGQQSSQLIACHEVWMARSKRFRWRYSHTEISIREKNKYPYMPEYVKICQT